MDRKIALAKMSDLTDGGRQPGTCIVTEGRRDLRVRRVSGEFSCSGGQPCTFVATHAVNLFPSASMAFFALVMPLTATKMAAN